MITNKINNSKTNEKKKKQRIEFTQKNNLKNKFEGRKKQNKQGLRILGRGNV